MISSDNNKVSARAEKTARKIKKAVAKELVDSIPTEDAPVSVFMAGSPGAGKTEIARLIKAEFANDHGIEMVHIENDELRKRFDDYEGLNSPLFQKSATILVEAIHDRALKKGVSFLLDSTLSSLEKARGNIERSLQKGRYVLIIYVYQNPVDAWRLVKARELVEGRRVPAQVFIDQFLGAQTTVNELKLMFGEQINLIFISKNINGQNFEPMISISSIDDVLPKKYNLDELGAIVSSTSMTKGDQNE